MKQLLPFLFFILFGANAYSQSGGDFLFTGMYADNPDGFAVVVVNPLPGSTNIYFTDDEWTGAALNVTEGTITWTTPAAGVPSGTVVTFNNVETGTPTIAATNGVPGTIVKAGSMSISGANEAILAYVGGFQAPTTFISAISNETISTAPGGLTLSGTNLDASNTIEFDLDEDSMTFDYVGSPCESAGMSAACIAAILDENNWTTDLGATNNTDITAQSSVPFSALPLPVELVSFIGKVKEQRVLLSWVTETEVNNSHFLLEKSTDGRNFEEISKIAGAGTTYDIQEYTDVDDRPKTGMNYYRLRQIDFDGTTTLSSVLSILMESTNTINIYPNPVKNRFQVSIEESGNTEALIYNMSGQVVQHEHFNDVSHTFSINTQELNSGVYNLQLIVNGEIITQRFVKQ